tara:strand:+ start:2877 stop:3062 length:186 start_codon:yes stop_codon:yes gene_type:complete
MEAESGIEPLYTALQAAASPLCHSARGGFDEKTVLLYGLKFGAGNEIRTRDPNLGKVVLYH